MELQSISFAQLIGAAAVVLCLVGVYNVVMTAVKTHRDEVKLKAEPMAQVRERLDNHEAWLASDKRRIEALEKHNKEQDQLSNIIVRSQLAMLRHMQHGNNVDGMKESEKEITDWLTGKE